MNIDEHATQYIKEQLEAFADEHSNKLSALLELMLLQLTFMRVWHQKYFMSAKGEPLGYDMLQKHMAHTLELASMMAGLSAADINCATSKSIEIVDYLLLIADPNRTKLH